jgi:hypothetical protein
MVIAANQSAMAGKLMRGRYPVAALVTRRLSLC